MFAFTVSFVALLSLLIPLIVISDNLEDVLFNGNYEFVDLTHSFNNDTVYLPDSQRFHFIKKIERFNSNDLSWYAAYDFAAGEHGGTHIDAPRHFFHTGNYVGDLPLEKLIVPLIIVDVSIKVNGNPDYVVQKEDLDMMNINCAKLCVLIFKLGWSQYFNDTQKYLGLNGTHLRYPGLSVQLAEWIVTFHKNIVGVGVDTPSVDVGSNVDFPVHKIFAKAGLYNVENINLHRSISVHNCTALVLPMKIEFGTGAPLRLVAICRKNTQT